jgi:small subunit ribosomal protein S21
LRGCTEESDNQLADVVSQENESFESLLRRFNKRVQQEGVLSELRRREFFEKPSIKRKRKDAAKKRKSTRPLKK